MSSALPRPANNDCIILFLIGGITSGEVKQIRETIAKYKATQQVSCEALTLIHYSISHKVLIGATSLLTPMDTVKSFCIRRL